MIDMDAFDEYMRKLHSDDYIKLEDCVDGGLYEIFSRNLTLGVYHAKTKGFTGIREKFGERYLFTEYHWDTGEPYGTVKPQKFLELCSIQDEKKLFEWLKQKEKEQ